MLRQTVAGLALVLACSRIAVAEPAQPLPALVFPSGWYADGGSVRAGVTFANPRFPRNVVTLVREPTTLDMRAVGAAEGRALTERGAQNVQSHDETVCGSLPAASFAFTVTLPGTSAPSAVEEVLFVDAGQLSRAIYFRPNGSTPAPGIRAAMRTGCTRGALHVGFAPPREGVWVERTAAGSVTKGTLMYESEGYPGQRIALFAVTTDAPLATYVATKLRPSIHGRDLTQRSETICGAQPAIVLTYSLAGAQTLAIEQVLTRTGGAIVSAASFRRSDDPIAPGVDAALRALCAG